MAMFKCNNCKLIYEDYYPPDDTCLKCKNGKVRIVLVQIPTESIMNITHIKEITLIMCECCCDFIIESDSQELKGVSYCSECISEYSNSN